MSTALAQAAFAECILRLHNFNLLQIDRVQWLWRNGTFRQPAKILRRCRVTLREGLKTPALAGKVLPGLA